MDADYLKTHVGDALTEGLSAVMINQPIDSVAFLAKYLLNHVDAQDQADAAAAEKMRLSKKLTEFEAADKKEREALKAKEDKEVNSIIEKRAELSKFLVGAKDNEGVMAKFVECASHIVRASGVYISELTSDTGAAGAGGDDYLKFIIATENDKNVIGKHVKAGEKGITLEMFTTPDPPLPEEEEEEVVDPVTGETSVVKKPRPEPPLRSVFEPNLLSGALAQKIIFTNLPKAGSVYAVKVAFESCLVDALFEEAAAKQVHCTRIYIHTNIYARMYRHRFNHLLTYMYMHIHEHRHISIPILPPLPFVAGGRRCVYGGVGGKEGGSPGEEEGGGRRAKGAGRRRSSGGCRGR